MQIKITPRTLGGTEFTAQPARLHLGCLLYTSDQAAGGRILDQLDQGLTLQNLSLIHI